MNNLERVRKVIEWLIYNRYAKNITEVALNLGYTKSSFSQIINGAVPLSDKFVKKLCSVSNNLNKDWIITGKGTMINPDATEYTPMQENEMTVPLLPVSAQGGSLDEFIHSVKGYDCEHIISPIKNADFAITVNGESMAPDYPNGSKVLVKKADKNLYIPWGEIFVIDTSNGTVIKQIGPSEREGYIRCISINPNPVYAPFEINMEDIFGMYRVLLCMVIR